MGDFEGADSEPIVKFTKDVQLKVVLVRFFWHWQYNLIKTSSKGAFEGADSKSVVKWTTCASFFDAPGYGTQTVGRHFRLESEPGRARSSGAERNRVGPNGAEWSRQRDWRGGWEGYISGWTPCSNRRKKLAQVVHSLKFVSSRPLGQEVSLEVVCMMDTYFEECDFEVYDG